MVQNSEWGPPLWTILHTLAAKCGRQSNQMLHMDEVRAWIHMLQLVEAILPCPLCQKHYRDWRKANPLSKFLESRNAFGDDAQWWLWRLHDSINEQRGTARIPFEEAQALYSTKTTADLQQALEKLLEVLERAKLQRLIDPIHTRDWRAKLAFLRRFLGV